MLVLELYYVVDFICVISFVGDSKLLLVLVMVVFFEGFVRYWFSFIYDSNIVDVDIDLIGLKCYLFIVF